MLIPALFTSLADLVSISQARRAAGFLPFAFAFAGGLGVLSRLIGPFLPPLALVAGVVLQVVYPGDFDYALDQGAPGWFVWVAVVAGVAGLAVGVVRRGPPLESNAALAAALFMLPVVVVGLARWTPVEARAGAQLSSGIVEALRTQVPAGAVVYSDPETSYRIAAFAPVYIAVAPPGHVADTPENRPYERARDARQLPGNGRPLDPGGLWRRVPRRGPQAAAPRRGRARAALWRHAVRALPTTGRLARRGSPAAAARRLDPHDVAGLEIGGHEGRQLLAVQEVSPRKTVLASVRALRGKLPPLGQQ